jgi:hypothetical protein
MSGNIPLDIDYYEKKRLSQKIYLTAKGLMDFDF